MSIIEDLLKDIDLHGGGVEGAKRVRNKNLLAQYVDIANSTELSSIKKSYLLAKFLFKHRHNIDLKEEINRLRATRNEEAI